MRLLTAALAFKTEPVTVTLLYEKVTSHRHPSTESLMGLLRFSKGLTIRQHCQLTIE